MGSTPVSMDWNGPASVPVVLMLPRKRPSKIKGKKIVDESRTPETITRRLKTIRDLLRPRESPYHISRMLNKALPARIAVSPIPTYRAEYASLTRDMGVRMLSRLVSEVLEAVE